MEMVSIPFDKKLLDAVDRSARGAKRDRVAVVQNAVRRYLQMEEMHAKAEQEREAYRRHPQDLAEIEAWEKEAVWLDE